MKVWVRDHTLCIDFEKACYLIRPCGDWDGKFKFNGIDIPWFKLKTLTSKTGRTIWKLFAVPYLCVGVVTMPRQQV